MKNYSFCNFKNTADTPILVEDDANNCLQKRTMGESGEEEVKPLKVAERTNSVDKVKVQLVNEGTKHDDDDFQLPSVWKDPIVRVKLENNHRIRHPVDRNIVDGVKGITLNEGDAQKAIRQREKGKMKTTKMDRVKEECTVVRRREPKHQVIRTRTSPRVLYDCIKSLNQEQRTAVEKMGLAKLLGMKIDGIPGRLGFLVVDKLNQNEMKIEVSNGVLDITLESIHSVLGVPMAGFDLLRDEPPQREINIAVIFKQQFPDKPKMRATDVMDLIVNTQDSGLLFKINFLVLFANIMGQSRTMGCCHLDFLEKINNERMMSSINWSQYIYDSLQQCKDGWSRTSATCFFVGPLTYLVLLYVRSTIWPNVFVDRASTQTHVWTLKRLQKRQDWEANNCGLGNAAIVTSAVARKGNVHQETVVTANVQGGKPGKREQAGSSHRFRTETQYEVVDEDLVKQEIPNTSKDGEYNVFREEQYDEFERQKKEDIGKIEMKIDRIVAERLETEELLFFFLKKYPGDMEFIKHTYVLADIFNYPVRNATTETSKEQESDKNDEAVKELVDMIDFNESANVLESDNQPDSVPVCELQVLRTDKQPGSVPVSEMQVVKTDNQPESVQVCDMQVVRTDIQPDSISSDHLEVTPTPLSQFWFSQTLHDVCDESASKLLANKKAKKQEGDETDMKTVNENYEKNIAEPKSVGKATGDQKGKQICVDSPVRKGRNARVLHQPMSNEANDRGSRRTIRLGDHLRSPYVRRAVDMKVTAEEKRYHEWAQAAVGRINEVFSLSIGSKLMRNEMATLARHNFVATNVIDVWADLLNCEEQYRNRDSLRRHFFSTRVMIDDALSNPFVALNNKYELFSRNLAIAARFNEEVIKFRNMDLVFFPVLEDKENYYLVAFNLKSGRVVVIDHRSWPNCGIDDIMEAYEPVVDSLRLLVAKHLQSVKHPAFAAIGKNIHEVLDMSWKTRRMDVDGGIFLMRHMETWMGDDRVWKTGFSREGPALKTQLTDLRKKYSAKIVLSTFNKRKKEVIEDADEFHNMDPMKKNEMLKASATETEVI